MKNKTVTATVKITWSHMNKEHLDVLWTRKISEQSYKDLVMRLGRELDWAEKENHKQ